MNVEIPPHVIQEHLDFKQKIKAYRAGKLDESHFRSYRASLGIYEQRQDGHYMLRPRIPSGAISLQQFRGIAQIARKLNLPSIHLTTRQDVQFHNLDLDSIPQLFENLIDLGLISKGTGGNTARNVTASPLSGVSQDDVFDVLPFAIASANHLLKDPSNYHLPRKFKIGFSNSSEDTSNATLADLGFIAQKHNGQPGFSVYGAGGLGRSANPSILLDPFCPVEDVLYYVEAMKRLFEREGDRTNRNKARIRFILKRLGDEDFTNLYHSILQEVRGSINLKMTTVDCQSDFVLSSTAGLANPIHSKVEIKLDNRLVPQKQEGKFSVYLHPVNGNLFIDHLEDLLEFIEHTNETISLRLDCAQGLYVRDLTEQSADGLIKRVDSWTRPQRLFQSVACTGASTCRLGICQSQQLLGNIIQRFDNEPNELSWLLPRLYLSGCPNSCGQHQKGLIGLTGRLVKVAEKSVPGYTISLGGVTREGRTKFGQAIGDLSEEQIPEFLVQLARLFQSKNMDSFESFIDQQQSEIARLFKSMA